MNTDIKRHLIDLLMEKDVCIVSDDETEYTIRCPYCGDSQTPTHAHLGIKIDPDTNESMPWHCFRCGVGGKVDDDFLADIDVILDNETIKQLRLFNKKAAKIASSRKTIVHTERYKAPLCTPNFLCDQKLDYVNGRLGTQFNYNDAQVNKIILSITQFMIANEIKGIAGVKNWLINVLERDYVGFLSSNNNAITFRKIIGGDNRYTKVILNQDNGAPTFYSIPTQLDLMYEGPLNVHIAEGTFDILSIKHNLNPPGNSIFYAVCGFSYVNILKNLARNGIVTHIQLHIYADRDKNDREHMQMLRNSSISSFIEHCYLHRNAMSGEKDYGVPIYRIKDSVRQLW